MKQMRLSMLVLLGFALLLAAACTPAATPTATPAPTNTPKPPPPTDTPIPSPTPIPPTPTPATRFGVEDPPEDGFHCVTGELGAASTPLSAVADVTRAWVEVDEANQVYLFSVEFGRTEALDKQFVGGLHIYDSEKGLVEPFDPGWFFNNTTNWSLNFFFTPPGPPTVSLALVEDGGWNFGSSNATATVEGNVLTITVPYEELVETSTWGWGLTNQNFAVCERVGYDENDRPSLALPPRP